MYCMDIQVQEISMLDRERLKAEVDKLKNKKIEARKVIELEKAIRLLVAVGAKPS